MDYSRPALADWLAAEYVLGTLRGAARRRFVALLPTHPSLRTALAFWESALAPLTEHIATEPPPGLWPRIEQQLFPDTPALAVPVPPTVVWLDPNPQSGAVQARFVASVSADGRALVLRPVGTVSLAAGRALELWAVPDSGAPRSLGLVSPQQGATVQRPWLLQGTAAFAVSVEPAGGSPTGTPTGPIVSLGKLKP